MATASPELWVWPNGHRCRSPQRRVPLPAGQRVVVGRAPDADVSLPVYTVGRHHLEVVRDQVGVWVVTPHLHCRTYVNRARIEGPFLLKSCDSITAGGVELRVVPAVPVDPSWLRWGNGTVPRLARGVYAARRFLALPEEELFDNASWYQDMPILHDALLDAGCDDQEILDHCKAPGPHALGCWVLDLLLAQE